MKSRNTIKVDIQNNDKMCLIIWKKYEYGLSIVSLNKCIADYDSKPIIRIPLTIFMKLGAIWSVLKLSTIFWEKYSYGVKCDERHNEEIKGAYLVSFASDLATISKRWVKKCIDSILVNQPLEEEVYAEIILLDELLIQKILYAIINYQLEYSIKGNIYTIHNVLRTN